MGKRQIRIRDEKISAEISQLLHKELNIVLKNAVTLHGRIEQLTLPTIIFRDLIRRKHTLQITDIDEIVLDQETLY